MDVIAPDQWCLRCGRALDTRGNHARGCPGNPAVAHNRLRNQAAGCLQDAAFCTACEQQHPLLRHRPDIRVDFAVAPVATHLDVSLFDPTAPSYPHEAWADRPERALEGYWDSKLARDYLPIPPEFAAAGHTLRPCVATVFGGWHPDTRAFFRECAQRAAAAAPCMPQAGDLAGILLGRWMARLGVAIARENAALLLRRCAHLEGG